MHAETPALRSAGVRIIQIQRLARPSRKELTAETQTHYVGYHRGILHHIYDISLKPRPKGHYIFIQSCLVKFDLHSLTMNDYFPFETELTGHA